LSVAAPIPSVAEVLSLQGTGTEAVMGAVAKVLSRGDVLSLTVTAGDGALRYSRKATAEEAEAQEGITYHDVVRARPLEEYYPDEEEGQVDPYQQLFEMFAVLDDAGFVPIVLLSGRPLHKLRPWLSRMSRKTKKIFGVRVVVEEGIPEDNLILCGSEGPDEGPDSVQFSVKVTLP
jgi:hypothetical protein